MSGKVIVSTDKRLEGLTLEDPAVNAALNTDTTVLLPRDKKTEATVLVAPVMGYDSRLGTLVMAGSSHSLLVADH
jgi:GTP-sensing pleiotropic transcriptional regulator CodY